MATYNWYEARFWVQTLARAKKEGAYRGFRTWGYVVRVFPRLPDGRDHYAWCSTKSAAQSAMESYQDSQNKGYWGCPCGSDQQARFCCGVPTRA